MSAGDELLQKSSLIYSCHSGTLADWVEENIICRASCLGFLFLIPCIFYGWTDNDRACFCFLKKSRMYFTHYLGKKCTCAQFKAVLRAKWFPQMLHIVSLDGFLYDSPGDCGRAFSCMNAGISGGHSNRVVMRPVFSIHIINYCVPLTLFSQLQRSGVANGGAPIVSKMYFSFLQDQ